jgi:hypothetical protein
VQPIEFLGPAQLFGEHSLADLFGTSHRSKFYPNLCLRINDGTGSQYCPIRFFGSSVKIATDYPKLTEELTNHREKLECAISATRSSDAVQNKEPLERVNARNRGLLNDQIKFVWLCERRIGIDDKLEPRCREAAHVKKGSKLDRH